ncbi:MAG: S-layer homology domain-containing protein [Chloroflexota bacterium]
MRKALATAVLLAVAMSLLPVSAHAYAGETGQGGIAASENPFADVTPDDWFCDSVLYVHRIGLMTGTAADTFSPLAGMTRAMAVTVLHRLSGDKGSYTNIFSDVPSGAWYENAVAWAAACGIDGGVGDGCFAPDREVTREQFAVLMHNYAKHTGLDVSIGEDTNILSYNDAFGISEHAYAALQWACGAGIIGGDDRGNLNPHAAASRAEVAAMLQRFMENVID